MYGTVHLFLKFWENHDNYVGNIARATEKNVYDICNNI